MRTPTSVRDLLVRLDAQGKLYRFPFSINKDTELIPLYRVELRGLPGDQRRAILFDQVVGASGTRFEMPVLVGCYGASEEILVQGLGCDDYPQALEHFHEGYVHPIPPQVVDNAPVHEEVHVGDDLRTLGLDELPAAVEEVGYSGIIRTGLPMMTRDPETRIYNVGTYNGFFYDRDRLVAGIALPRNTMQTHWRAARARGEELPVAIVIGPSPAFMLASSAQIPYGVPGLDEITLAGGLEGTGVRLVPCKTLPLEVPAEAEAVIEGWLSTEEMEPSFAFGEYPGYMRTELNVYPVVRVTAITHRKRAIFTPITVGFWPSDSNTIIGFARSALIYHHLKYECGLPVAEVYFPQEGGGVAICFIRMQAGASPEDAEAALLRAEDVTHFKYSIAVDCDIDVRSPEAVVWALSFSTRPAVDIAIVPGGGGGVLDPSLAPTGASRGTYTSEQGVRDARVRINATRKWPYPPVGLPGKAFMTRALELWNEASGLPPVQLKAPWHGYPLGHWTDELQEVANLMTRGEYRIVGEKAKTLRVPVTEQMLAAARGDP